VGADGQGFAAPRRRRPVSFVFLTRAAAAVVAVGALFLLTTLPPRAIRLATALPPTFVPGAVHVHSVRGGGSGDVDAIAAAASRAGLKYVVLTDHGDGTRAPDPPAYRHGVLSIDAVEISTLGGHLLALGLQQASPYPLAGEARDVVEDVHRLGGRAFAAHPDSPRPELRWRGGAAPIDGIEWLNADSEWRDESRIRLIFGAMRALVRPPEAIVALFSRPTATLASWDRAMTQRPLVAIAAADAHARIGGEDEQGRPTGWALSFPSYKQMFRALSQVVRLDAPLSGDAVPDAAAVLAALVGGRSFSVINGIATPARVEFFADQDGRRVHSGGTLTPGGSAIFQIEVPGVPAAGIVFLADGDVLAVGRGTLIAQRPVAAKSYRVEVYAPGIRVPWMLSNPIFATAPPADPPPQTPRSPLAPLVEWRVEHDPSSTAAIDPTPASVRLEVVLGDGAPAGQYAAAVASVTPSGEIGFVQFTARASAPVRLSVQLRAPREKDGLRWRRSVYVDPTERTYVLPIGEFDGITHREPIAPFLVRIDATLFVVDTLNSTPGTRVSVWISGAAVAR
jgi:hypothetical protein